MLSSEYCTPGISFCRSRYSWPTGRAWICSVEMALAMVADSVSISEASAVTVMLSSTPATPSLASATTFWASCTWALRLPSCIPWSVNLSV